MKYTVQPRDSFPSIAEALGHSGEWRAIAELNPDIDPGTPFAGTSELDLPDEWAPAADQPAKTRSATTTSKT